MKKKMYSILLAACLFVGLAIPAFALEFGDSALAGDATEITQLMFNKSSYTVRNGETLQLADNLTAYCGNSKICLYTDYSWSASDSLSLGVDPNSGEVTAYENSGSITVTVVEQTSGKKATVKVTATKADSDRMQTATGFKFDKSAYTFYTGDLGDEQTVIRVVPTPAGRVFTNEQKAFLTSTLPGLFLNKASLALDVKTATNSEDQNYVLFGLSGTSLDQSEVTARATKVSMNDLAFPNPSDPSSPYRFSRTVNITVAKGVPARNLIKKGSVRIQVGQTVDLNNYLQFPSSANYGKNCTFELTYVNDNSNSYDYAVLADDQHTIKGVAVGHLKAIATLPNNGASAEIPIQVVARSGVSTDTPSTGGASITPTIATLRVGASITLTAKNVNDGANVSWFLDNESKANLVENGRTATVTGVAAGTVKILAYADKVEIGTSTLTISSVGTTPPTNPQLPPPTTSNPLTGDSWFSGLF